MDIAIIVAMDKKRTIGHGDKLPWHIPRDLQHFKETTMGHPIIMGRKTHESIGKTLQGRTNIVVTRNQAYCPSDGAICASSLDEALEIAQKEKPDSKYAFVIGGSELYKLAMPHAQKMYVTVVDTTVTGDVTFPSFDTSNWEVVSRKDYPANGDNSYGLIFKTLKKN